MERSVLRDLRPTEGILQKQFNLINLSDLTSCQIGSGLPLAEALTQPGVPQHSKWMVSGEYTETSGTGLTERAVLVLAGGIDTIPGGAGAPEFVVVPTMTSKIDYLLRNRIDNTPIHVLMGIHIDAPTSIDSLSPNLNTGNFHSAAQTVHAERSCGVSGGFSKNIVSQLVTNVNALSQHLGTLASPPYKAVTQNDVIIHPLYAVLGKELDKNGQLEVVFHIDSPIRPGENYKQPNFSGKTLLTGEELDGQFRKIMDNKELITGLVCIDSRQGFTTADSKIVKPIDLDRLSQIGINTRNDWQGLGHSEHMGIAIVDGDPKATALAIEQIRHPSVIIRNRSGANWASPSSSLILKIFKSLTQGERGNRLKKTMQKLISTMDTHVYRKSPRTTLIGQPYRVFTNSGDDQITEVITPPGFQMVTPSVSSRFFETIKPGIFIDSASVMGGNMLYPGSKRKLGPEISP